MNRFRMNLGPAVTMADVAEEPRYFPGSWQCEAFGKVEVQWPNLCLDDVPERKMSPAEERETVLKILALTPIEPVAYVGTSDWNDACTRLQEVICKAESAGFSGSDIDAIVADMDETCAEGLNAAADRLNAAVLLSVAMPHVTLKPEPVREVKPAISGLTTVRGE